MNKLMLQAACLLVTGFLCQGQARATIQCDLPYALDKDLGVIYTTDCGLSWFPAGKIAGVPPAEMTSVSMEATGRVIVSTETMGLFASDDDGMTWGQSAPFAALTVEVIDLLNGEAIPAGSAGRFRVTVHNGGPDASTNTTTAFAWFRTPLFGDRISANYSMRPSQGHCSRSLTPEPDCFLGTIPAGAAATIEFDGSTEPRVLGMYTLRVWVASDQAAPTLLAEVSKGTSVTIAESGGGAAHWSWLVILAAGALLRVAVNASRRQREYRG